MKSRLFPFSTLLSILADTLCFSKSNKPSLSLTHMQHLWTAKVYRENREYITVIAVNEL